MSVKIEYRIGGRKVSQRQFTDGLEGEVRRLTIEGVTKKVQSARCPVHNKPPRVTGVDQTADGYQFKFGGCCDKAVAEARRLLS